MNATNLGKLICMAASEQGHRLFRQNTGQAWVGEIIHQDRETITLRNYRPLHAGLINGSGDYIGWTRTGLFASVEVKVGADRMKADQLAFARAVCLSGGRAGMARSVEEALAILAPLE